MIRRRFLQLSPLALCPPAGLLPGAAPAPIPEPHFPSRLHQFVWRNWELANTDRMARVLQCAARDVLTLGRDLGLPPKPELTEDQLRRIHITVIRQNWHLLPNSQLIELLGWTPEKLAFILKEDDFLDIKLGAKPDCEPVLFRKPDAAQSRRAAEIRRTLTRHLGRELKMAGEAPFHFIERLSDRRLVPLRDPAAAPAAGQVDLSGWSVKGEGPAAAAAGQLERFLRAAMGSAHSGGKTVALRIDPAASGGFSIEAGESAVSVTGGAPEDLLQAVYWLQDRMEEAGGPFIPRGRIQRTVALHPRYLYPFFALYGDPLLEPGIDPFPDGYLEKLARAGIAGVWMQCVLSNMAPSRQFPEFGRRSAERLANLNKLLDRLEQFGMRAYLYLNEPRTMPPEFFAGREHIRGVLERGVYTMCTSTPEVREWISGSLTHLFTQAPRLGGVFSITASENLTNCHSHFRPQSCPRCSKRTAWEVIGEVIQAFQSGVRRVSPKAEVIAWDWGWNDEIARNLIPRLPRDVTLMSVSEWSTPIERGGVKSRVGEYSISVVGPGPRATAHWALARAVGIRTMAKTQFNNTWEMSAVPYIPVPHLIARHCSNLRDAGVSGIQASWTVGGYPSPNLEVAKEFYFTPAQPAADVLRRVASRRYGRAAAEGVLQAWKIFSDAFEEYPYSTVPGYIVPVQHGPANLLRIRPTGVRGSMILFPQDDMKRWVGPYPPPVARDLFARMAERWQAGLDVFRQAAARAPRAKRALAAEDAAIAETCYIHFRSVADQIEFYRLRDDPAAPGRIAAMRAIAGRQRDLARRLYTLARTHSVIAYEASNHYYYRPLDLAEAVISCQYLLDHELKENRNG